MNKILCQLQGRRQGRTKILYGSELFLRSLESGDAQGHGKETTRSREKGKENFVLFLSFGFICNVHLDLLLLRFLFSFLFFSLVL